MSEWATIKSRDTLEAFPCVNDFSALKGLCCFGTDCYMDDCAVLPFYRQYMALSAVVEAVLGDLTPAIMAAQAQEIVGHETDAESAERYRGLEQAWEAIA